MLNTRIVHLRPLEESDLPFLRELANDPDVRANVVGWDWPLSDAGQLVWFNRTLDDKATKRFIVESETRRPIGMTGFWEIDWRNRTAMTAIKLGGTDAVRGRGYGAAAIQKIMEFGFLDVGLNRLHASILASNARSLGAYVKKCGWVEEGRLRQHIWRDGEFVDLVQIGIMRAEFLELQHSKAVASPPASEEKS